MTLDRHLIGDIAIAFLLAVPTVAMSRPQPVIDDKPEIASPLVDQDALGDRSVERG